MTSKKTKVVSGRITYDKVKEMKAIDLNVVEAIQIALNTKRTPEKMYRTRLRSLISENEYHASMIACNNLAIDELTKKIGFEGTLEELKEELFMTESEDAIQTTLERFESVKGTSSLSLMDFISSKNGARIIDIQLQKTDLTKEDFINLLIEKHDKSIQTKLDS